MNTLDFLPEVQNSAVIFPPSEIDHVVVRQLFSEQGSSSVSRTFVALTPSADPEPSSLLLGTLFDQRVRVVRPIEVVMEKTDEFGYVAQWLSVAEFGIGDSRSDAVMDLGKSVAELYLSLNNRKGSLGTDLKNTFKTMQDFLVRSAPVESE